MSVPQRRTRVRAQWSSYHPPTGVPMARRVAPVQPQRCPCPARTGLWDAPVQPATAPTLRGSPCCRPRQKRPTPRPAPPGPSAPAAGSTAASLLTSMVLAHWRRVALERVWGSGRTGANILLQRVAGITTGVVGGTCLHFWRTGDVIQTDTFSMQASVPSPPSLLPSWADAPPPAALSAPEGSPPVARNATGPPPLQASCRCCHRAHPSCEQSRVQPAVPTFNPPCSHSEARERGLHPLPATSCAVEVRAGARSSRVRS